MRIPHRHAPGFTLVELLIYIGLMSMLLLALTGFFTMSLAARAKTQSIAEVDQQGAAALEQITHSLRNADVITTPATSASGNSLSLVMQNAAVSPTVVNLSGTILQIQEASGATIPLTNARVQISNLTFRNLSRSGTPGMIQVSFTVASTNPSNRNEYDYQETFTTTVALR